MEQLELFKKVETQVCTKCKINKPFSDYHKSNRNKNGLRSVCKECRKQNYENNKNKIKERYKIYYENNKNKIKLKVKEYYENNPDKVKENKKKYAQNNKEKISKRTKKWRENNKYELRKKSTEYCRKKRNEDSLFKLKMNIRALIRNSIKKNGYKKNTKTYNYLGCESETLLNHLNNNKYNFIYGDEGLDIDHIIPLASAKNEDDVFYFNYYKNLQLLPSEFNRYIKRDRLMTLEEIDTELKEWLNKKPC